MLGPATLLFSTRRSAPQPFAGRLERENDKQKTRKGEGIPLFFYHVRTDLGSVAEDQLALFVLVKVLTGQLFSRPVGVQEVRRRFIQ